MQNKSWYEAVLHFFSPLSVQCWYAVLGVSLLMAVAIYVTEGDPCSEGDDPLLTADGDETKEAEEKGGPSKPDADDLDDLIRCEMRCMRHVAALTNAFYFALSGVLQGASVSGLLIDSIGSLDEGGAPSIVVDLYIHRLASVTPHI
jgi:hypothetical protein